MNFDELRYNNEPVHYLEGTIYSFSSSNENMRKSRLRTGQTLSPHYDWPSGRLVKIGELLRNLILAPQAKFEDIEDQLIKETNEAIKQLSEIKKKS
jgi:hypothetical protein